MSQENTKKKRQFVGIVMTNTMVNTITVRVIKKNLHPLYRKVVKKYCKYMVHNEVEGLHVGDTVRIEETNPISKNKRWKVVEKVVAVHS